MPPGRPPMLALFDIDGTLIDSAGVGRAAIEIAMQEVYGTAGPIDELPFDGMTDPRIVGTLLGAADVPKVEIDLGLDRLWSIYAARLEAEIERRRDRLRPAPGVPAILDLLEEGGAVLGLVTGNIAPGAERKLSAAGLWHRFSFGAFGCDSPDRNRLPPVALERARRATGVRYEPGRSWIIGDTPHDVACATACGFRMLGVATGRFSVDELMRAGADHAVPSLLDMEWTPAAPGAALGSG